MGTVQKYLTFKNQELNPMVTGAFEGILYMSTVSLCLF